MKIVLTGGGTAGHVMPNIALLPNLEDKFQKIYYIGCRGGIEERIAKSYGIEFYPTPAVKLDRSAKLANLRIPIKLSLAVRTAKQLLVRLSPDVVFAKGGYVSLPACLAARSLKIPVVCHESDFTPGLANKIVSRFAVCTLTSFKETQAKHAVFTGNPVRTDISKADKSKAERACAFSRSAKTVLFVGGSSGAAAINRAVDEALPSLVPDFNVVHICGAGNLRPPAPGYRCFEFVDNIFDYFAFADVVISRAGANCASELLAMGKRVIFVPLPAGGASRGDQIENAKAYARATSAKILEQDRLNTYELICAITDILSRPAPKPDDTPLKASAAIADILEKVAKSKSYQ